MTGVRHYISAPRYPHSTMMYLPPDVRDVQPESRRSYITGGNVVRDDRTVMQMKSLRDHPDMSYGSSKQWK